MTLLTLVASLLIGHSTPVYCNPMPGHPWTGAVYGMAAWPPDRIYLRDCRDVVREQRWDVNLFAHEILHIEHKRWPHWRVYATEHSYGAVVLRTIERVKHR